MSELVTTFVFDLQRFAAAKPSSPIAIADIQDPLAADPQEATEDNKAYWASDDDKITAEGASIKTSFTENKYTYTEGAGDEAKDVKDHYYTVELVNVTQILPTAADEVSFGGEVNLTLGGPLQKRKTSSS